MPRTKSQYLSDDETLRSGFAKRLAQAMELRGIDRQDLASAIGADSSHIGKIARGNNWPGSDMMAAMCRHLGISLDWLVFGTGPVPARKPDQPRRRFELVPNAVSDKPEPVVRERLPDAVIAFLATEGDALAPGLVSLLKSFDYDATQMRQVTLDQVRRLATLLATELENRDS